MTNSEAIFAAVDKLVKKHGTGDPFRIAEAEKIKIYYRNLGSLAGFYTYMLRHRVIALSDRLTEESARMVLAHELGHDILHRELAKEKAFYESGLFDSKVITEYEANAFAAHLLIPTEELLSFIRDCGDGYSAVCSKFGCDFNLVLIKIRELNKMGWTLNVPAEPDSEFFRKKTRETSVS